ncbi:radical SAM protein [bacterium]|nr:radical SAM protein [bacterium]
MTISQAIKTCFEYFFCAEKLAPIESVFSQYEKSLPSGFIYHYPTSVIWKVTSACNLRCKHCFYYANQKFFDTQNDLTKEEALNFAKYLAEELNIMYVILTGGEIFLSPYLFDLIKYFKSKNICITLLTNGTLINENIADKLTNLLNKKYDNIQISLEGATEENHDAIRGAGTFKKTLHSIETLINKGFPPSIATTITSKNVKSISEFTEFCANYKIKELRFGRHKVFSDSQKYLTPNLDDLLINFAKLINNKTSFTGKIFNAYDFLKYEYGKQLLDNLNAPQNYTHNKLCHNHNKFFISSNGNIYLCSSAETEGLSLGNIRENSFKEIWQNRFSHPLFKERINFICAKCKYKYWCNSGCPVVVYKNNGNITSATLECEYQNEIE